MMASEATWTPGPWTAHKFTVDQHWPISAEHGDGRAAVAHAPCEYIDRDESRANARLIAAAPDLYEALDEAINYLAAWSATAKDETAAALLDKCTAALARARGKH